MCFVYRYVYWFSRAYILRESEEAVQKLGVVMRFVLFFSWLKIFLSCEVENLVETGMISGICYVFVLCRLIVFSQPCLFCPGLLF